MRRRSEEEEDDSDLLLAIEASAADGRGRRRGLCPRCVSRTGKEDRHGALCMWPSGFVKCYKCDLRTFIDGYSSDDFVPVRGAEPEVEVPEGFETLYQRGGREVGAICHRPARRHMRKRGFSTDVLAAAGVGATLEGKYHHRIIMPLLDDDDCWVGFVARTWLPKPKHGSARWMKYRNSDGLVREDFLHNRRALDVETDEPAWIVEGYPDHLVFWPNGIPLLGEASQGQFDLLARSKRPLVFVLDGDAWKKGESYALQMRLRGVPAGALRLPPKTDPDEIPLTDLRTAGLESLRL